MTKRFVIETSSMRSEIASDSVWWVGVTNYMSERLKTIVGHFRCGRILWFLTSGKNFVFLFSFALIGEYELK